MERRKKKMKRSKFSSGQTNFHSLTCYAFGLSFSRMVELSDGHT
jgi:hypothetical protein